MRKAAMAALLALAVPAAAETYRIDPAHSSVTFKIRHFVSKVAGRFKKFDGSFDYEAGKPATWKAEATIDAASIDTDNERRDNHLRTPDFFDVDRCPKIEFKSAKVEKGKDGKTKLKGDLTMHCVTRPVTLGLEVSEPLGDKIGAEAHGRVNRKDFGLIWNKALDKGGTMLGDDVDISIDLEASPAKKG